MDRDRTWSVVVTLMLVVAVGLVVLWSVTAPEAPPRPAPAVATPPPEEVAEPPPPPRVSEPPEAPVARARTRQAVPRDEEGTVKDVVARYSGQLRYCYEKQLKDNPGLSGRVEVRWTVSGGAVTGRPSVVADTTGDAGLADCIASRIRRWRFPADVDGEVSFPFVFRPK